MTLPHDHGERQMTVFSGGRFRMGPLIQGLSALLVLLDGFYTRSQCQRSLESPSDSKLWSTVDPSHVFFLVFVLEIRTIS